MSGWVIEDRWDPDKECSPRLRPPLILRDQTEGLCPRFDPSQCSPVLRGDVFKGLAGLEFRDEVTFLVRGPWQTGIFGAAAATLCALWACTPRQWDLPGHPASECRDNGWGPRMAWEAIDRASPYWLRAGYGRGDELDPFALLGLGLALFL